jgi:hypothetical protein
MKNYTEQHVIEAFESDVQSQFKESKAYNKLNPTQNGIKNAITGIEKYDFLHIVYLRAYGQTYLKIAPEVRSRYYHKMFDHLSSVNVNDLESLLEVVHKLDSVIVRKNLNKLLNFFINLEEYEKCAVIKSILDILPVLQKI